MMAKYTLKPDKKRSYYRDSTMPRSEIMLIMILFHDSGYRCLKHFYLEKVCKHLHHLFPKVVSYNRFVEFEKEVAITLALFIKKVLPDKCTGISCPGQHSPESVQESEDTYPQGVQGYSAKWQVLHGLVR